MNIKTLVSFLLLFVLGCTSPLPPSPVTQTSPAETVPAWSVYHPDPNHPWNQVFRQLYRRMTSEGDEYGADELDPLLWFDSTHLLTGPAYDDAIRVLDEFLLNHAEQQIEDPLRRAMFQRDLWAVFDWLAWQEEPYPAERKALETRLAQIMKRVSLSKDEIASLPDNYAVAVESKIYPLELQTDSPEIAFLPGDLFQPDSVWVSLGREGGPVALTHTESFPFFGRSAFLVFARSPAGREGTLRFIESLNTESNPATASGSEVALVRRMLLIDDQGEIVLSPLIETIQLRHFRPEQSFYEFELDRAELFTGTRGGLVPNREFFPLFMSHGDPFANPDIPELQVAVPDICKACHFSTLADPEQASTQSIVSYSRQPFSLPNNERPVLFASTVVQEARAVIQWKWHHNTWKALEALWKRSP